MNFDVIPAIDLRGGRVVRLRQGQADAETVYADAPAEVARRWAEQGARWLHVVDLDGAFQGRPVNEAGVRAILESAKVPVQLGGGLRTRDDVERVLRAGVARVVVGTQACRSPEFVRDLVAEFGERVAVGVDARDGFVAVNGWVEKTQWPAVEFAQRVEQLGVETIVFTDVSTDGMLSGPNYFAIRAMAGAVSCRVIASGGVGSLGDVERLCRLARELPRGALAGVIVGKALYDGRLDLRAALAVAREGSATG